MKVNWYPGTTKAATDQGYEVVDQSGDAFFAPNPQRPENRGWGGRPQPMVSACDGRYVPFMADEYEEDHTGSIGVPESDD